MKSKLQFLLHSRSAKRRGGAVGETTGREQFPSFRLTGNSGIRTEFLFNGLKGFDHIDFLKLVVKNNTDEH